jgi:imidazolonepropionase-like amidohydrolase
MVGVMPYHQYFKHMRSPLGMAIGKPFMKRYMPIPTPTKAERAEIEGGLENMRAMTKRLHEAGVNLVVGTDSPNPSIVPGFSLHQEMAMLVRCGIPPLAVLTNATATAAKLIDRPDLGKVNPNASADLVLLDGNPIDNISNSMKIQAVIKAGKLVDRERVLELAKGQKGGMDEASNRGD